MKLCKFMYYIFLFNTLFLCLEKSYAETQLVKTNNKILREANDCLVRNPDRAYLLSNKVLQKSIKDNDELLETQALYLLAMSKKYLGNFDESINSLFQAATKCPQGRTSLHAEIYKQISDLYCRLKDFKEAFNYNQKATDMFKTIRDSVGIASCYNNKGLIHTYRNEFKTADFFFKKSLGINRELKNTLGIAANLNNMCLYEGDIKEKIRYINEAIAINKKLNATWSLAENYNNKGRQYYYNKEYQKSLKALRMGKKAAVSANAKDLICDNYEYLSWVYSAIHQYDKAYHSQSELFKLTGELQQARKLRNIERKLSEQKLEDQAQKNKAKAEDYEIEILQRNIFILIGIILLTITISILLAVWYKKKKSEELIETKYHLEQSKKEVAELKIKEQKETLENIKKELSNTQNEVTNFAMLVKSKNEILDKISLAIKETYKMNQDGIIAHLRKTNSFIKQYQNANEANNSILCTIETKNKEFIKRLLKKHPKLTPGEKHLSSLLRVSLTTKEISLLTGTLPKTINMNRYRLRKSLDLKKEEDLVKYLQNI